VNSSGTWSVEVWVKLNEDREFARDVCAIGWPFRENR